MPGDLEVRLNAGEPHAIDVASPSFTAEGDFDIVLRNHGSALHVHLNFDGALSAVASLGNSNHYVDDGGVRRVRVAVDESRLPAEGRLKIVTGYGAETAFVTVRLVEPDETTESVRVDERLGKPQPRDGEPLVDPEHLPAVGFGLVGLLVAVLAVVVIHDPVVLLGVLVVIVGVGIAGLLVTR